MYILTKKLDKKKRLSKELRKIYGLNEKTVLLLCDKLGIGKNTSIKTLTKKQKDKIQSNIKKNDKILLENTLKKEKIEHIKQKKIIKRLQNTNIIYK